MAQILDGTLDTAEFRLDPTFKFEVPKALPEVPPELLAPRYGAKEREDYDKRAKDLAAKFVKNFEQFKGASAEIVAAGPKVLTSKPLRVHMPIWRATLRRGRLSRTDGGDRARPSIRQIRMLLTAVPACVR